MSISKTRQKLIDIARQLFAKRGVANTTMNDIAVASGKGRRTLYTYFNSKEEVYSAVIESELERLSDKLDGLSAPLGIQSSGFRNKDHYGMALFTITYDISAVCPACNKD